MTQFVQSLNVTRQAKFTRPSDTNTYAAADVVCDSTSAPTIMTFPNVGNDKRCGLIVEALLTTSANQTLKPDLELWLFDTTVAMDNDNATFTPTDTEILTKISVIKFPFGSFIAGDATSGSGGNASCDIQGLAIPFNTVAANINDIYGILVVRNAYIPISGEVFQVRLKILH